MSENKLLFRNQDDSLREIKAKDPNDDHNVFYHICYGSRRNIKTRFISFSDDLKVAEENAGEKNHYLFVLERSKVEKKRRAIIHDFSSAKNFDDEFYAAYGHKKGRFYKFCKGYVARSREVLVENVSFTEDEVDRLPWNVIRCFMNVTVDQESVIDMSRDYCERYHFDKEEIDKEIFLVNDNFVVYKNVLDTFVSVLDKEESSRSIIENEKLIYENFKDKDLNTDMKSVVKTLLYGSRYEGSDKDTVFHKCCSAINFLNNFLLDKERLEISR